MSVETVLVMFWNCIGKDYVLVMVGNCIGTEILFLMMFRTCINHISGFFVILGNCIDEDGLGRAREPFP